MYLVFYGIRGFCVLEIRMLFFIVLLSFSFLCLNLDCIVFEYWLFLFCLLGCFCVVL